MANKIKTSSKQSSSSNIEGSVMACSILSYLVIGVIWYFVDENMRKNEFVKYHAKQGLMLIIASIVFSIISTIPLIGWTISWILEIILLVWLILGIVNVVNHQKKPLFVIGPWAEKW